MFVQTRAAFRLARVGLHLLWGAATVRVVYPWIDARFRRALKRRWSRQLLETLGIHLKVGAGGTALPERGLVVCNHISWLDIYVINALTPAAFVSKDDVKHWPLIGGDRVLPFHAALFQSAIDAETPVIPLALRYVDRHGNPSRAPAYDGDITLWQCLRTIALTGGLTADLRVLEAIDTQTAARRELSTQCRATIAWHLGQRNYIPHAAGELEVDAPHDDTQPVAR